MTIVIRFTCHWCNQQRHQWSPWEAFHPVHQDWKQFCVTCCDLPALNAHGVQYRRIPSTSYAGK